MALADRIVVMNGGRIEQCGRPEELYRNPETLFIAGFIGRSNAFPGAVESRAGDRVMIRSSAGDLIEACDRQNVMIGQQVVCVVRPERLSVAGGPTPAMDRNMIRAKVQRRSFFGSSVDLVLRDGGGREIIVQMPEGTTLPDQEEIIATFAPRDTLCFAAPGRV